MARRRRGASRGGGLSGFWKLLGLVAMVIAIGMLTFSSGAFSAMVSDRNLDAGVANDQNALLGLDITDEVLIESDSGDSRCELGPNPLRVNGSRTDDVDTSRDVLVTGDPNIDVSTAGAVEISDGARLYGGIDSGGCVVIESNGYVDDDIDADGSITIKSDGEVDGSLASEKNVVIGSGASVLGDIDAVGDVTTNGQKVVGDIDTDGSLTVGTDSKVDGSISASGSVVVQSGGTVLGDIDASRDVTIGGDKVSGDVDTDGSVTVGSDSLVDGGIAAGGDITIKGTVDGDVDTEGGVLVESGGKVNGDVSAGECLRVTSDSQIDGDAQSKVIEGEAYITGDADENEPGSSCGDIGGSKASGSSASINEGDTSPSKQLLLTVTNNLNERGTITVAVQNSPSPKNTLYVEKGGATVQTGEEPVQFTLNPGEQARIKIEPSEAYSGGEGIRLSINIDSGTGVTAVRQVPVRQS